MSARGGRRILRDLAPFLCIATHFFFPLRWKRLERTHEHRTKRSLPTYYLVGTPPWSVLVFNAHSLVPFQDYRTYAKFQCSHAGWYAARTTAREMWHPCPECAKCITPGRLYDPSTCAPCQTFLPLSDVPRGHATWPVCIVSRQQNLDKVEQDVGQQVDWEQRGPPPGSRSHPACATCMTYGRWYEPNHRYLHIPFTCTWVLYDYFS